MYPPISAAGIVIILALATGNTRYNWDFEGGKASKIRGARRILPADRRIPVPPKRNRDSVIECGSFFHILGALLENQPGLNGYVTVRIFIAGKNGTWQLPVT